MSSYNSRGSNAGLAAGAIVVVIAIVYGIFAAIVSLSSFTTADGGHVIVVRNGGEFDNNDIRQVITSADGRTYSGWFSKEHPYPTSQRNFTISPAAGSDSNDPISANSSDGVNMTITGNFLFQLNTDPTVLKDFDNAFGTRQFNGKYPWDGDDGWQNFLNVSFKTFIEGDLRQEIGKFKCEDLYASCALIKQTSLNATATTVAPTDTSANFLALQTAVSKSFAQDIKDNLGENYFTNIKFVLSSAVPPAATVTAIQNAQNAFAANASANAAQQQAIIQGQTEVKQAQLKAQANEETQKGYTNCPVCAEIDKIKALPQGLTTYVPGGSTPAIVVGAAK